MNNTAKNIIRTATPAVVGAVASEIAKVTAKLTPSETAVVFPIATTLYYAAIHYVEKKYPKLSWLLGALPVKAEAHVEAAVAPVAPQA